MFRAIVFDFDGLILDSELPYFTVWQDIYASHGAALDFGVYQACIGTQDAFDPCGHLEDLLGRTLDRDALRRTHRERYLQLVANEAPLPGVEDWVRDGRDRGLRLGVASSSDREWVTGNLRRLRLLDSFHCVRTRQDVSVVKPDPQLYRSALEALGVPPSAALAIEDSPNGIAAAKAAGMCCLAVPNTLTARMDLGAADLVAGSLDALTLGDVSARLC